MSIPKEHPLFKEGHRVILQDGFNKSVNACDISSNVCKDTGTVVYVGTFGSGPDRNESFPWMIHIKFDTCNCDEDFPGCNGWPVNAQGEYNIDSPHICDHRLIKMHTLESLDNRFSSIAKEL